MSLVRVAVLGPAGTNSEAVAFLRWGRDFKPIHCKTFEDIFNVVLQHDADHGIIPAEETVEGDIDVGLDLLSDHEVFIANKLRLPVEHSLLCKEGLDQLRRVGSHPRALAQCKAYINKHFPNLERATFTSTAAAAEAASRDPSLAAIANISCANQYNLKILEPKIMTTFTDFFDFTLKPNVKLTEPAETSVVIYSKEDAPGLLAQILEIFAKSNINLTKIFSRSIGGLAGRHKFFLSFEGNQFEPREANALKSVETLTIVDKMWVFGSYPRPEIVSTEKITKQAYPKYGCILEWFGRAYVYTESFGNTEGEEYMVFKRRRFKLGFLPLTETLVLPTDYIEVKDNVCTPSFAVPQVR